MVSNELAVSCFEKTGALKCFSYEKHRTARGSPPAPRKPDGEPFMATYHLHISSGTKSTDSKGAGVKVRYLLRDGPYAVGYEQVVEGANVRVVKTDRAAEMVYAESGNMPGWAAADPVRFWDASDEHERANGCVYREVEVGLPEELSLNDQIALAQAFAQEVARVTGGVTPYTLAIHQQDPEHPDHRHAHILLSDRIVDGNDRTPETFFKRYNAKSLEKGGAKKSDERQAAKTSLKKNWSGRLRPLWEQMANDALDVAGVDASIDHRTLDAQRMELEALARQETDQKKRWALEDKADALDRPAQPKKGRVLTHVGADKAPDRAAMVIEYEKAKAERLELARSARIASRAIERLEFELARAKAIQEAQHVRHDRRDVGMSRAKWQDRQTARDTSPGIRHPEPPKWQQYREQVLADAYNRDVAEALGRWVRIDRVPDGLRIHNQHMDITDHGDRITAGMGGQEKEIEAILKLARAKGWKQLDITGSPEFRQKLGRAALDAGFSLSDTDLQERIMEQRRQDEEARETADLSRVQRLERAFHWGQLDHLDDPHNRCQEAEDARNGGRAFIVLAMVKDANANAFAIVEPDPQNGSKPLCFRCCQDLHVGQHVRLFVGRDGGVEVVADISPVDRPTTLVAPSAKRDDAAPG